LDGNEKVMKVNKATHFIQKEFPLSIVGAIRDYICVLFPSKSFADQGAKAVCEKVRYDLDAYVERGFVAGIGAGKAYEGINGLRKSLLQAEVALRIGTHLRGDVSVKLYEDLGIYRLLSELIGSKELSLFMEETIQKLESYDASSSLNLVHTLEVYFAQNEHLSETAKMLYIHVNTLKYRL